MALNAKQKMFVQAYLLCKNATKAAIEAGYAKSGAGTEGHRLLKNAEIKARIRMGLAAQEADMERKARVLGVTRERMIQELARTAFANMNDFANITDRGAVKFKATHDRKPGTGHAIKKLSESVTKEGGSTSLELHSKDRAQELLCKLLGWTKEELNLNTAPGGVQVILTMPSNGRQAPKKDEK
jgi:hypothetical protein